MSVYNNAGSLRAAAESVLRQTWTDLELILVDDGSTDASGSILDALSAEDARVQVLRQANTGLTRALIAGCALARGRYIARHDADDVSAPQRMALQVQALDADANLAFVSCRARALGPGDEVLFEHGGETEPTPATERLLNQRQGPSHHGSVMFRADAYQRVGGYRAAFYYAQDADLWLRMAEQGQFRFLPEMLYTYRISPYSISLARRAVQKQFGQIGQRARRARAEGRSEAALLGEAEHLRRQLLDRRAHTERNRRALANGHYFVGAGLQRQGSWRALIYLLRAIHTVPWHGRAWLRLLAAPLLKVWYSVRLKL